MKKIVITSFIAGILITLFLVHAYNFYSMAKRVSGHEETLRSIVDFLNKSIEASNKQSPTPEQSTTTEIK